MLATENLNQKNYLPQNLSEEISADEKKSGDFVIFSKSEWKHFIDEVNKQIAEKVPVDFSKAARNARYLNRLDEAFANIEVGRWTEHELIEVDDNE